MTLLPCILDKTSIFLDHLERFAETGETFEMDYYATGLTFDIIGPSPGSTPQLGSEARSSC